MNSYKIGDRIKLRKLSIEEFEKIYHIKYNNFWFTYYDYLDFYDKYSNQIFEIIEVEDDYRVYCNNCSYWLFNEELEKIDYLKTKFKIVKELLNDK